jgi:hypothetical protein
VGYIIEESLKKYLDKFKYLEELIAWHANFIYRERDFFLKFFPDESIERFEVFVSQNQFKWIGDKLIQKFQP